MVYSADEALEHLKTCRECQVIIRDSVRCTVCGSRCKRGYILSMESNREHLSHVRVNGTSQIMYWGLCLDCSLEVDFRPPMTLSERDCLDTIKFDLEKSMQAFKDRIYGRRS